MVSNPIARNLIARRVARLGAVLARSGGGYTLGDVTPGDTGQEQQTSVPWGFPPEGVYLPRFGPTPDWPVYPWLLPLMPSGVAQWLRKPPRDLHAAVTADRRAASQSLPRGAPPADIRVQPVWDSRLVNMRDFLAAPELTDAEGPVFPGTVELAYTVPQGYTGFLRGFRFVTDPLVPALLRDVRITLLVDDIIVPDFQNLPLGSFQAAFQECFVIGRANQRFILRAVSALVIPADVTAIAFLYGHLRLTDGRPASYDVGEPIKPPVPKPLAPPVVPIEQPAAPPVVAPTKCGPNEYYSAKWGCVPYVTAKVARRS